MGNFIEVLTDQNLLSAVFSTVVVVLVSFYLRRKNILKEESKTVISKIILTLALPSLAFDAFMSDFNIYKDIAERTNGDIYVGVVGPVRTGKSTFIKNVMEKLVLPNVLDGYSKDRTRDEMPQSGDGKSIMTTQPKFIPNEAVSVKLDNDITY